MVETEEEGGNPYLEVVAKKVRALRKKYEKARSLELQQEQGKELNDEQVVLLQSKIVVERMLKEYEGLRTALLDVVVTEEKPVGNGVGSALVVDESGATLPPSRGDEAVDVRQASIEQTTQTDRSQTQDRGQDATATAAVVEEATVTTAATAACDPRGVKRLLKLLHVVARYTTHTGNSLPSEVDYFGKVILGKTSLPEDNFNESLEQSVHDTLLYLQHDSTKNENMEVAHGMSFSQLDDLVEDLSIALSKPPISRSPQTPAMRMNLFADSEVKPGSTADAFIVPLANGLPPAHCSGNATKSLPPLSLDAIGGEPQANGDVADLTNGFQAPLQISSQQHVAPPSTNIILDPMILSEPMPVPQDPMVIGVPATAISIVPATISSGDTWTDISPGDAWVVTPNARPELSTATAPASGWLSATEGAESFDNNNSNAGSSGNGNNASNSGNNEKRPPRRNGGRGGRPSRSRKGRGEGGGPPAV